MTYLEVAYRYQTPPGEAELRAIDSVREVYGIQCIQFNEKERTVRVLFDASRLKGDDVAKLLRQAGIDVQDQLVLALTELTGERTMTALRPFPCLVLIWEDSRGRAGKPSGVHLATNGSLQGAFGKTSGRSIFPNAPLRATSSSPRRSMSGAIR